MSPNAEFSTKPDEVMQPLDADSAEAANPSPLVSLSSKQEMVSRRAPPASGDWVVDVDTTKNLALTRVDPSFNLNSLPIASTEQKAVQDLEKNVNILLPYSKFPAAYLVAKIAQSYGVGVTASTCLYEDIPVINPREISNILQKNVLDASSNTKHMVCEDFQHTHGEKAILLLYDFCSPPLESPLAESQLRCCYPQGIPTDKKAKRK